MPPCRTRILISTFSQDLRAGSPRKPGQGNKADASDSYMVTVYLIV